MGAKLSPILISLSLSLSLCHSLSTITNREYLDQRHILIKKYTVTQVRHCDVTIILIDFFKIIF